eukprot:1192624-Amphidinium_carterae.1
MPQKFSLWPIISEKVLNPSNLSHAFPNHPSTKSFTLLGTTHHFAKNYLVGWLNEDLPPSLEEHLKENENHVVLLSCCAGCCWLSLVVAAA